METRRGSGARSGFSMPAPSCSGLLGASREEMLMWSPVPATQSSAPVAHSSPKRRKAGGASGRIETWGFPSLGESSSVFLPTPALSVKFPPGEGVGCGGRLRVRPKLQSLLSHSVAQALRTHTHAHPHTRSCTDTHTPTCFRGSGKNRCL